MDEQLKRVLPLSDRIGTKIRIYRKAFGISQTQLASQIGITAEILADFECNGATPSLCTIEKIADVFGIGLRDFLDDDKHLPETIKLNALLLPLSQKDRTLVLKTIKRLCRHLWGGVRPALMY